MVSQKILKPLKFGKKSSKKPASMQKLPKLVQPKTATSVVLSQVKEFSSTTTTKTGGAVAAVVKLLQLVTRAGRIQRYFMILVKNYKMKKNMA